MFFTGLKAQEAIYSGSDDKLTYKVTVEKYADEVNDRFNEYYALEITNTSDEQLTFTPVFNFRINQGAIKNTASRDQDQSITLAPGQTLKGDYKELRKLVLFKQFLVGKSGKKASETMQTLESISINY
ncbi:hypothetical protein CW751_04280 [Brumimicrobium salinarum]|uniref:Uncharacterized protein n=1 Tax=Brumimicrobium salinarum TaxID=2058658 RepID=A0A2I0R578_9FLAO|nr:hypothetical protein CW751_04280 [Brumimicrobium salinarum]